MLKPGMQVTTNFIPDESNIIRTILNIKVIDSQEFASATGGDICPTCGKTIGTPVPLIISKLYRRLADDKT